MGEGIEQELEYIYKRMVALAAKIDHLEFDEPEEKYHKALFKISEHLGRSPDAVDLVLAITNYMSLLMDYRHFDLELHWLDNRLTAIKRVKAMKKD